MQIKLLCHSERSVASARVDQLKPVMILFICYHAQCVQSKLVILKIWNINEISNSAKGVANRFCSVIQSVWQNHSALQFQFHLDQFRIDELNFIIR